MSRDDAANRAASDVLTRAEAEERAGLVSNVRYDVELDLTKGATTFESETRLRFRCDRENATTFVDLFPGEAGGVDVIELNGRCLASTYHDGARIQLEGLAEGDNELRVRATCSYSQDGATGLQRILDGSDQRAYVYTQFETNHAQRVFACFDQPDLKGVFTASVRAPRGWEALSGGRLLTRPGEAGGLFRFAPTLPISTYVLAFVVGPYHSVRETFHASDGRQVDLGVFCRRSLAEHLDADEVLTITRDGFTYFEKLFGYPYPFGKYDQIFVPDFKWGGMEHIGCVTLNDARYLFTSRVTQERRQQRAEVILHELAHMWFGDLVTMRWWDDLWLNESFATTLAYLAVSEVTPFKGSWTAFTLGRKATTYALDQGRTTHPVADPGVDNTEEATSNVDDITYGKGGAALVQLMTRVGRVTFFAGVREYFRRYQFANTTRDDFIDAITDAAGGKLGDWPAVWVDRIGVNKLRPSIETGDDGTTFRSFKILQEAKTPPDAPGRNVLRPHEVDVGLYHSQEGRLVRQGSPVRVSVRGEETPVKELEGKAVPDLVLLNDGDLAYAKIRLDDRSLDALLAGVGGLEEPINRALGWFTLWDMVRDAEIAVRRFLEVVHGQVRKEPDPSILNTVPGWALLAAVWYGDPDRRREARQQLADDARGDLQGAPPGSDPQLAWAQAFIGACRSDEHTAEILRWLEGGPAVDGLLIDQDMRWNIVRALAAAGAADQTLIEKEERRDTTNKGKRQGFTARASLPDPTAKATAWRAIVDTSAPVADRDAWMAGFRQADQEELLTGYAELYFDQLEPQWQANEEGARRFARSVYPLPTPQTLDRTERYLRSSTQPEEWPIRRILKERMDETERILRTRTLDAKSADS